MEMTSNLAIVIAIAFILVMTWTWKILSYFWFRPKMLERYLRDQGLKGNPYSLGFGDLKCMKRMTIDAQSKPINVSDDIIPYVVPFHYHIIQKYGKKSFIWIGPNPIINILEPQMIKDVLFNYKTFQKPSTNPLSRLLVSGLLVLEGEKWAKHRKILSPAFSIDKIKQLLPAMIPSCSQLMRNWETLMPSQGSCEIDVWPYLEKLTSNIISQVAFGSSDEGKWIFQLQEEPVKLMHQILNSIYIPGWRFLPTKLNRRLKQINLETRVLTRNIINKREKEMDSDDLLGILLESNRKEIQEHGDHGDVAMSIDDVIEECKLFYHAGQETTSTLLLWTMVMLGMHKNWQTRARDEVLQVFGNNNPITMAGLNHLKIMTMILKEVLRLYPPAAIMFRSTHKKIKLGDMVLPPGVGFALHTAIVHRDTEIWGDDAKEFNPERFAVASETPPAGTFFPFSLGPRICIGKNVAMAAAKMTLAMILQHFTFELSPSYAHAPFPVLTTKPRFGANMILHKI